MCSIMETLLKTELVVNGFKALEQLLKWVYYYGRHILHLHGLLVVGVASNFNLIGTRGLFVYIDFCFVEFHSRIFCVFVSTQLGPWGGIWPTFYFFGNC